MNGRKSIGALASVTVVAIAASMLLALATIDPPGIQKLPAPRARGQRDPEARIDPRMDDQ